MGAWQDGCTWRFGRACKMCMHVCIHVHLHLRAQCDVHACVRVLVLSAIVCAHVCVSAPVRLGMCMCTWVCERNSEVSKWASVFA